MSGASEAKYCTNTITDPLRQFTFLCPDEYFVIKADVCGLSSESDVTKGSAAIMRVEV